MREHENSMLSQKGAQNQAVLPTRTAIRLSLQGITTRFGRSVVTVIGVGLGIAFLMSVLSGFHIKHGMREEAALNRGVERRLSLLRSEIGMLERRHVVLAGAQLTHADLRFVNALRRQGGRVSTLAPLTHPGVPMVGLPEAGGGADAVLCLGATPLLWTDERVAAVPPASVYVFADPDAAVTAEWAGRGVDLRALSIRLRPDDLARAERREAEQRMRMYWVVVVSLLITVGGITNAMLMSVTERFREIATMKCLGALSGFVVKLFLIESSLIGFGGSVLGVLVGLMLPLIAYSYTFGPGLVVMSISWPTLAVYMGGCVVIGMVLAVLAGIYPARVAARMIPADALRTQV